MRLSSQSGRMNRVVRISAAVFLIALLAVNTQAAVIRRSPADKESSVTSTGSSGTSDNLIDIPILSPNKSKDTSTTPAKDKDTTSKDTTSKDKKDTTSKDTTSKDTTSKDTTNNEKDKSTDTNTSSNGGSSKVPTDATSNTPSPSTDTTSASNAAPNGGNAINAGTAGDNVVSGDKKSASTSESASAANANPSKRSEGGLSTMTITCIAVGGVILASVVGIFVLRKLKFTNTSRRTRLEAPDYNMRERSNSSDAAFLRHLRN
ncbi:hypothetical protein BDF22DRAFT_654834 [Syncephalis plumigaleata]|nr:hypothetical protein BDF22DRAFT_654834 [Syncephalis plumigaleata]